MTNVITLNRLHKWVANAGAITTARDHNGKFRFKPAKFLDVKIVFVALELLPGGIDVSCRAHGEITFSIVTVATFLEQERPAKFCGCWCDGGFIGNGEKARHRQARVDERLLLRELVLNHANVRGTRPEGESSFLKGRKAVRRDELVLERNHIGNFSEAEQRLRIVPITDDVVGGEIGSRAVRLAFQDGDVATQLARRLGDHLGQLSAADDAESW